MLVVLSLAGLLIPLWINRVAGIENEVKFIANNINQELLSGVQRTAALFSPINASTINLARMLKSSLDKNDGRHISKAESMVASTLFQALWTIPNLRQISYIGLDGLLFAYYTDQGGQPYALYSNSTFSSMQNDTKNYPWYIQPVNRDNGKLYGEAIKAAPLAVVNSSWFQEALKSTNGYASVGTGWANSQDLLLLSTAAIDGGSAVSLGYSMKSLIDFLISETAFYNGSLYLATKDGNVLTQGIPNTRMILDDNKASFQLLGYDDDRDSAVGSIMCQSHDGESVDTTSNIWGRKYVINCSAVEIAGLQLMEACTRDLLGILNSILDTSKIEAGKMQLEEEEFDIEQLLEDVVDLYHPVGMKKGVDVILDPYDGSITKCSHVKGDRGKLKQILCNLLSNAVKFTSEGHVTIRAWARNPSIENEILASNQDNSMSCLCCLLFKIERAYNGSEVVNTIRRDPNHVEFVFEVNDTGKGIPKEKQKSIFENYVQVKETALGLEGTGLGLGTLDGWRIGIVDKEIGERGTCFRFNVFFFSTHETHASTHARATDIEAISSNSFQHLGPIVRIHNLKTEGSKVILFVQSDKRSKILQSFMQRLGIKVHVVKHHEQLSPTLKRIKQKLNLSTIARLGRWLDRPNMSSTNFQGLDEDKLPASDLVITRPFHGSRLYETIRFLPEFGGMPPRTGETSHNVGKVTIRNNNTLEASTSYVVSNRKPLMGKKILVADDDPIGRKIAASVVSQLGANIVSCENGEEAWRLVYRNLMNDVTNPVGASKLSIPFDCILMDCQMPMMDGVEATWRIREAEKRYDVHTPIIALTAHDRGEEIKKMIEASAAAAEVAARSEASEHEEGCESCNGRWEENAGEEMVDLSNGVSVIFQLLHWFLTVAGGGGGAGSGVILAWTAQSIDL
ncbi:UNVERIFIED_CONTAM: Histidine kinase CKI1 [Sesamum angustifolium]|uniref:histidine kinase n=1 Tax=Sesamum angustifolium TaxID=2727405 RepID=A0AAW2QUV6_9LAMI